MPPSGFNHLQVQHLRAFLTSCASALEAESKAYGETLNEALAREIHDIDRTIRDDASTGDGQVAVLKLVRTFYRTISRDEPQSDVDYRASVSSALDQIGASILSIHVEPTRGLSASRRVSG